MYLIWLFLKFHDNIVHLLISSNSGTIDVLTVNILVSSEPLA